MSIYTQLRPGLRNTTLHKKSTISDDVLRNYHKFLLTFRRKCIDRNRIDHFLIEPCGYVSENFFKMFIFRQHLFRRSMQERRSRYEDIHCQESCEWT